MSGLDYIVENGGDIYEAVASQAWPGDASLNVSIVNWIKGKEKGEKILLEQEGDSTKGRWKSVKLDFINSQLFNGVDVSDARTLEANKNSNLCHQGQTNGHDGFLIPRDEAQKILENSIYANVLHPFMIADDFLSRNPPTPSRYCIDFGDMPQSQAQMFRTLFNRVESSVLADRKIASTKETTRNDAALEDSDDAKTSKHHSSFLNKWWKLSYRRTELMDTIAQIPRYIACSRTTKRPIFVFIESSIHPNDALQVFPAHDDYTFGILSSDVHWQWFVRRCSTLVGRPRYTSTTVWDTFPWPQDISIALAKKIAKASQIVREERRKWIKSSGLSIRSIYTAIEKPGNDPLRDAHKKLNDLVLEAYGISSESEVVGSLMKLNSKLSQSESKGKHIQGPGLPAKWAANLDFYSSDSITNEGEF